MKALLWLQSYWYVPGFILLVVAAALLARLTRRKPEATTSVTQEVTQELKVIEAEAEVRRVKAELGHEKAKQFVEDKYRETRAKLTEAEAAEAKILENDPVALSRFLVQAGRK